MTNKPTNTIQLLSEMVDSYNMLHNDYLKTDSISESEQLQSRMKATEKDMLAAGACINLSISHWENFLFSLPEVIAQGDFGKEILKEALKYVKDNGNYNVLEKIYAFEDAILATIGKQKGIKQFYGRLEIMEQTDEKTVTKHVIFREYMFIPDQAINLMKENIKAI